MRNRTFGFFSVSYLLVFILWFAAAYASQQPPLQHWVYLLILLGMSSPTVAAIIQLVGNNNTALRRDFFARLRLGIIKPKYAILALLFMPSMVFLASAISLIFGGSADQFFPAPLPDQSLAGLGYVAVAVTTVFCVAVEELGWRGYGIPSLWAKFTLFRTSVLFGILWFFWHLPAFFIEDGYFQQEILNRGAIYVATYFTTLFSVTFFINWVYAKNQGSILLPIMIHASMNLAVAFCQIEPVTRIIFMGLMIVTAMVVVAKDRRMFFSAVQRLSTRYPVRNYI